MMLPWPWQKTSREESSSMTAALLSSSNSAVVADSMNLQANTPLLMT
jgi:hypothetical protein